MEAFANTARLHSTSDCGLHSRQSTISSSLPSILSHVACIAPNSNPPLPFSLDGTKDISSTLDLRRLLTRNSPGRRPSIHPAGNLNPLPALTYRPNTAAAITILLIFSFRICRPPRLTRPSPPQSAS